MADKKTNKTIKYINLFLIAIIFFLIVFIIKNDTSNKKVEEIPIIRIGAGNDISGLGLHYMDNEYGSFKIEPYFIQDCWAPISQWALSSNAFDMAIVCKDAAKDFMTAAPEFEIVGPVVMNSDIVVEAEDRSVKIVGITNNKNFHKDFARDLYGKDVIIKEMNPNSLPYAYGNEQIDAMIIDITVYNDENMEGRVRQVSDEDYLTNVLIANSEFTNTKEYRSFVEEYNIIVDRLNQEGLPMKYIEEKTYLNERSVENWNVELMKIAN